jgi:hypothetical protein
MGKDDDFRKITFETPAIAYEVVVAAVFIV